MGLFQVNAHFPQKINTKIFRIFSEYRYSRNLYSKLQKSFLKLPESVSFY